MHFGGQVLGLNWVDAAVAGLDDPQLARFDIPAQRAAGVSAEVAVTGVRLANTSAVMSLGMKKASQPVLTPKRIEAISPRATNRSPKRRMMSKYTSGARTYRPHLPAR